MTIEYKPIKSFEEIINDATFAIAEGEHEFNRCMAYALDVSVIGKCISDVTEDAKMWAEKECPPELYINHGSYIKDGMEHIIKELNDKSSSNRALFSLISQENISGSGDKPIPSFMIFQTCIDENTLYCTAYFRALEISTFFRINIEEIRLKIEEIYQNIRTIKKVNIVIFAFRAYHKSAINPLKKAKIDLMTGIKIFTILNNNPYEFNELFEEKAKDSTVISLESLSHLLEALNEPTVKSNKNENLNFTQVNKIIKDAIENGNELRKIRTQHSHHSDIEKINNKYIECLKKLSREFEKCR